jgi:hypothetical protein
MNTAAQLRRIRAAFLAWFDRALSSSASPQPHALRGYPVDQDKRQRPR